MLCTLWLIQPANGCGDSWPLWMTEMADKLSAVLHRPAQKLLATQVNNRGRVKLESALATSQHIVSIYTIAHYNHQLTRNLATSTASTRVIASQNSAIRVESSLTFLARVRQSTSLTFHTPQGARRRNVHSLRPARTTQDGRDVNTGLCAQEGGQIIESCDHHSITDRRYGTQEEERGEAIERGTNE